jgi:hypothetical protein
MRYALLVGTNSETKGCPTKVIIINMAIRNIIESFNGYLRELNGFSWLGRVPRCFVGKINTFDQPGIALIFR